MFFFSKECAKCIVVIQPTLFLLLCLTFAKHSSNISLAHVLSSSKHQISHFSAQFGEITTEWVAQSTPMSCPVTCTDKTNMPAAFNAFANTYLFVVTERHCVFLLPFSMVAFCGSTRYNFCCFLFWKLTNNVHFIVSWVQQLYAIHSWHMHQPLNQMTKSTVRETELL